MKLSQMETAKACEVMCNIAVPLGELAENPVIDEFYTKYAQQEMTVSLGIKAICKIIPVLLRDNAEATYAVISALSEKPIATLKKQPITETIQDVRAIFDGELLGFFRSLKDTEQGE